MENNISKEFYLLCKKEGITKLETKADIARVLLVAENNDIIGTEEELTNKFNDGKEFCERQKKEEYEKKRNKQISISREIELEHIENVNKLSKFLGREKPISKYEEKIAELQSQIAEYNAKILEFQKMSTEVYRAGVKKEKDWAIHGGIASGLAGGAAGLATALDIQRQNAEAKVHNQELFNYTLNAQMSVSQGYYAEISKLESKIQELRAKIQEHKNRLVDNLNPRDLLIELKPRLIKQEYTETGAVKLTVETQPTSNIKIYEKVKAVVDGSFKALLIDNDEIVGEVAFALPYCGATKKNELVGYCTDTQNFNSNKFEVVFVPINLWAIEEKGTIEKAEIDFELDVDYINYMLYYSAKEILKNDNKGIKEFEDAIWLLESTSNFEKAKILVDDCKAQIKAIKDKEKAEKIEKEKREQAERDEEARIAKRNKKIAMIVSPIVTALIACIIILNTVIIPGNRYDKAIKMLGNNQEIEALPIFVQLGDFKDSKDKANNIIFSNYKILKNRIELGTYYTVALNLDGTVSACGIYSDGSIEREVSTWTDIISVSVGSSHVVGVKSDGSVVATGDNKCGQCEVTEWSNIVDVYATATHTIGLKSDGTVISTKYIGDGDDWIDVSKWTDIVDVYTKTSYGHAIGLKSNGTVVATGGSDYWKTNLSTWTDIVDIYVDAKHTIGLKKDGTVVATDIYKETEDDGQCNVSDWTDILEIDGGMDMFLESFSVGLKKDGTVVAAGSNKFDRCDVSSWSDIISISSADEHTVGLKKDGTVVAVGYEDSGRCNVSEWKDIVCIYAGEGRTVGLKVDGSIVVTKDTTDLSQNEWNVQGWNLFK